MTEAVILYLVFGVETGWVLLERSSCFSRGDGLGAIAVELRRCWRRQDWHICGDDLGKILGRVANRRTALLLLDISRIG